MRIYWYHKQQYYLALVTLTSLTRMWSLQELDCNIVWDCLYLLLLESSGSSRAVVGAGVLGEVLVTCLLTPGAPQPHPLQATWSLSEPEMSEVISPGMLRDTDPRRSRSQPLAQFQTCTTANPVDCEQGKLPCVPHQLPPKGSNIFQCCQNSFSWI